MLIDDDSRVRIETENEAHRRATVGAGRLLLAWVLGVAGLVVGLVSPALSGGTLAGAGLVTLGGCVLAHQLFITRGGRP